MTSTVTDIKSPDTCASTGALSLAEYSDHRVCVFFKRLFQIKEVYIIVECKFLYIMMVQ